MQLDLVPRPVPRRLAKARERATAAMEGAASRIARDIPGWLEQAAQRVRAFARAQGGVFTIEQMRAVLEAELPQVPDRRVWGAVTRRALRQQVIKPVPRVTMPAVSSNGSLKPAYRRGDRAFEDG